MARFLRMKPEYIGWTKEGKKTATTRLHEKSMKGLHELVSGSRYKPVRSGVLIGIKKILRWTFKDSLDDKLINEIVKAEGFSTFEEFWTVLKQINGRKLRRDTPLYTHFYDLFSVWEACDLKP